MSPQDSISIVKRKLKKIRSGRNRETKNRGIDKQIRKEEEEEEEERKKNKGPDWAGRRRLRSERKTQIGWKKKRTDEEEE